MFLQYKLEQGIHINITHTHVVTILLKYTRYMYYKLQLHTHDSKLTCNSWFTRRGELKEKPTFVVDYNEFMLGVDKLDQLMSYYSFLHKSVKWWRKIFFWLLEVVVINAYIIHKELARLHGERPMSHWEFRRKLILSLS